MDGPILGDGSHEDGFDFEPAGDWPSKGLGTGLKMTAESEGMDLLGPMEDLEADLVFILPDAF